MKSRLYGIRKVFTAPSVGFPFHTLNHFVDGECVVADADWSELCLARKGSLTFTSNYINNSVVFDTVLEFDCLSDFNFHREDCFFLAETVEGKNFLIGLGADFETIPSVETSDSISDSASSGNKFHVKVSWVNPVGRVGLSD